LKSIGKVVDRHTDITEITRAVTRRNVHAAAKHREMGKIAATPLAGNGRPMLLERLACLPERDVTNIIANGWTSSQPGDMPEK
jgi:hypothetical protein